MFAEVPEPQRPNGPPTPAEIVDDAPNPGEDLVSLVQAVNKRTGVASKLNRVANILRYYRTSQLLSRAVHTALPAFLLRPLPSSLSLPKKFAVRSQAIGKMRAIAATRLVRTTASRQTLGNDISKGKFTLLSQTCQLGSPIDWQGQLAPHPSRLWRFQLHYQEYLLDLAIGSAEENAESRVDSEAWPVIWQVVADWMNNNPLSPAKPSPTQPKTDAWHPYCLSRRLPVWAQLFALQEPPENLREQFLQSFALQTEVLSKTLEFDLGGNHLLENLSALAIAAAFLEGPPSKKWLKLATRQLQKQLSLQVLPHGEHYERAPMYHCQMLGNLLQIAIATAGVEEDLAQLCRQTATPMYDFLQSILHPDGEIPLFGDSCWGEVHSVQEINALARLAKIDSTTETDSPAPQKQQHTTVVGPYWISRSTDDVLIFDTGPAGAQDLPAHAHCDLLGFEASIGGQRWFIDSGLFDYDEGAMRDYCRSSVAHNVVTVDNQNCCDVWSRFRMGRRGWPVDFDQGQQEHFSWCQASHNGYRHLGVPKLSRLMLRHTDGLLVCLENAPKTANRALTGRIHLKPGIQLERLDSQRFLLTQNGIQRWLTVTSGSQLGLAKGWYCNRFGRRVRTQVITYGPEKPKSSGCTFGWSLSPSSETSTARITIEKATQEAQFAIRHSPEIFRWPFLH